MKNIPSCGIQIQAGLWAITTVQEYSLWEELSCSDLQGRYFVQRTKQNKMPWWIGPTGFISRSQLSVSQAGWLQACCTCCIYSLQNIFCRGMVFYFPCIFTIGATMETFDLQTLRCKMCKHSLKSWWLGKTFMGTPQVHLLGELSLCITFQCSTWNNNLLLPGKRIVFEISDVKNQCK